MKDDQGLGVKGGRDRWWAIFLALFILAVALAQTWPLGPYFSQGIPYGRNVVPGYEMVPLVPGDHLQFNYWLWVLKDNLFGPSAFFTNPYEFNTVLNPQGVPNYANFPFSLLYLVFLPLGPAEAYNALVFLSYLLAGLCAYGLARQVLGDNLAALPAGLLFAFLPLRQSQALSGHLYGFVVFLLPLTLWFWEKGLKRASWRQGAAAGLCLVAASFMESHLIYYTSLLLGLYVPLRLLLLAAPAGGADGAAGQAPARPWAALAAGLGLGLFAHLVAVRTQGAAFWSLDLPVALIVYLFFSLVLWALGAGLLRACTFLDIAGAKRLLNRGLWPLALSPLYAVQFVFDAPLLGKAIIWGLFLWGACRLFPRLWRVRRLPRLPRGAWAPVWPLCGGLFLGAARMLQVKAHTLDVSIAGRGRTLQEVKLFTPQVADLFHPDNVHTERLIYFGLVLAVLSLLCLVLLAAGRSGRPRQAALASLWIALGLLALLLSLGPTMPAAPLYELLFRYLPFFNFPRVAGRLIAVAVLFLSLGGGWAIKELSLFWRIRQGTAVAAAGILALALAADTWPARPTGICLLPPPGPVEEAVRKNLPVGPAAEGRLLGLPIWPGDSHQSSIYELLISHTRAKMLNGYCPVVPRAYVEEIFWPLYGLDLGLVEQRALATLRKNQVRLVAFYDDELVYPRKVSPFPPALARRRLLASGLFSPVAQKGPVFLWSLNKEAKPGPAPKELTSPVTSLWEAFWLYRQTGVLMDDPQASGWGLLFEEGRTVGSPLGPRYPWAKGNIARARAGRDQPGFLSFGPHQSFPPGRFLARFRLRRGPGPEPGWVEVCTDQGRRSLAKAMLRKELLPADGRWHDVPLNFRLGGITKLEFRTYFAGKSDLDLDVVLISFADSQVLGRFLPAAELWRQCGDLVPDGQVPGGLAVSAQAGYTPPLYLMHGPQQTCPPGGYVACFRLALTGDIPKQGRAAELAVAMDLGRRPLARRILAVSDLGRDYRDVCLDFVVPRRCEVGLRVKFSGGASLRLAGATLRPR